MVVTYEKKPRTKLRTDVKIDEVDAFWQLLRRTVRGISKAREDELQEFGVSSDMSAMMFTIALLGKQAIPANIAKNLLLEAHSVSQLVSRMERKGLVHKTRDLERKNLVHIELTEAGWDLFRKTGRRRPVRKIMAVLTDEERRQMWVSLAKLRDAVVKELRIKKPILFPPSDFSEL